MPTITTVDATWTNGTAMDEAELRRADSAMFLGDGSNNGVRGGIVRHGDNSLSVSVNGSDQVSVTTGAAVIPAATGLGVYRASLAATTSAVALSPRNATNPRIDLVVMQIESGAAVVKTVDGTPSASPSAPALPASAVELGRVTVPALGGGAVTVSNAFRAYATALGGTIYVETAARLPGSGSIKGQRAIALDTLIEHTWSGSAWLAAGRTITIPSANGNFTNASTARVAGRTVTLYLHMTAIISVGANSDAAALTGDILPPEEIFGFGIDNATGGHIAIRITTGGVVRCVESRAAGTVTRATVTYVI